MPKITTILITYGERLEWDMCTVARLKKQNAALIISRKFEAIGLNVDDYNWINSKNDSEGNIVQAYNRKKAA